jgi:adenosylcobyric acid synthase
MGFALASNIPVVLVGDIDRGGVIAALIGTHVLLDNAERKLLKAFIVNKFRGDVSLFADGAAMIAERTGLACLGIVPFFDGARHLPREDAMSLESGTSEPGRAIKIVVPRLSRIANFDDLDPLAAEDDVTLDVVPPGHALPGDADLVLLPGTKATLADLAFLRAQGWDLDIAAHVRRGGAVAGLCGGYQMLGAVVRDPDGIEGRAGEAPGLGLLDVETTIGTAKILAEVNGTETDLGTPVEGFEMHMGQTAGPDCARPWLTLSDGRAEGAVSADGQVRGSYLHGIFAGDGFRHAYLSRFRPERAGGQDFGPRIEHALDALADHLEDHLDLEAMLKIARARTPA